LYSSFKAPTYSSVIKPVSNLMNVFKDITFIYDGNASMSAAIDEAHELEFVENIEYIDKFDKENVSTYTIRVFLKPKSKMSNDEITESLNTIIGIFNKHGINLSK
jgi:phenylalanyl-tRNA synthetase beta subunit